MDHNELGCGLEEHDGQSHHLAFQRTIDAYRQSKQRAYDGDRRLRRFLERKAYQEAKEAAGGTVRRYRSLKSEPRLAGEDDEAFRRRMKRERDHEQRGVNAATVRPYLDLSSLTPAEKTRRKAEQAAERKRKQRARKRDEGIGSLDPEELRAVAAVLAELDYDPQ